MWSPETYPSQAGNETRRDAFHMPDCGIGSEQDYRIAAPPSVMAGLDPAIHGAAGSRACHVDSRLKAGHDEGSEVTQLICYKPIG